MTKDKLIGFTNMFEGEGCAKCGNKELNVIISQKRKIKGLEVEDMIPLCEDCAKELNVRFSIKGLAPDHPVQEDFNNYMKGRSGFSD